MGLTPAGAGPRVEALQWGSCSHSQACMAFLPAPKEEDSLVKALGPPGPCSSLSVPRKHLKKSLAPFPDSLMSSWLRQWLGLREGLLKLPRGRASGVHLTAQERRFQRKMWHQPSQDALPPTTRICTHTQTHMQYTRTHRHAQHMHVHTHTHTHTHTV